MTLNISDAPHSGSGESSWPSIMKGPAYPQVYPEIENNLILLIDK